VFGEVHSRSPAPSPSARQAMCSAAVALLTATACRAPQYAASAVSKRGTVGPWVSQSERSTSTTASMSSAATSCLP
jgi:hypothetical protein